MLPWLPASAGRMREAVHGFTTAIAFRLKPAERARMARTLTNGVKQAGKDQPSTRPNRLMTRMTIAMRPWRKSTWTVLIGIAGLVGLVWLAAGWGVVAPGGGERAGEPRPSGSRHRQPARLRAGRPPQRHGRSDPVDHHRRPPPRRSEHPIARDHATGAAGQHRAGGRPRGGVRPAAAADQRARPPRGARRSRAADPEA